MQHNAPMRAQKKPMEVESFVFQGWANADRIIEWRGSHDGAAYYVGRGYEHRMRRDHEFDRSNGHLLEDAEDYLVVKTRNSSWVRVDRLGVVIMDDLEHFEVLTGAEFKEAYDLI